MGQVRDYWGFCRFQCRVFKGLVRRGQISFLCQTCSLVRIHRFFQVSLGLQMCLKSGIRLEIRFWWAFRCKISSWETLDILTIVLIRITRFEHSLWSVFKLLFQPNYFHSLPLPLHLALLVPRVSLSIRFQRLSLKTPVDFILECLIS